MPRQNPFQQLRFVCEGPESEFETICVDLIRTQYPNCRRVRVHRGDGGVDAAHGDWGTEGALDVIQVKYFPEVLGDSQKEQVRKSYSKAFENPNFRLRNWILCLPTILRQDDQRWFDEWRNEQDVHIELWDGDKLEGLLALPGSAGARERLKKLGAVGGPLPAPVLVPGLVAKKINVSGVGFELHFSLSNIGDQATDDVRLLIEHTYKTGHVANLPARPWTHENRAHNPWELSLPRSLNPSESISVISVPFGTAVPTEAKIKVEITSRTTSIKTWYAEVTADDITGRSMVSFASAIPDWPQDAFNRGAGEPHTELGRIILGKIQENADVDSQGLTEILIRLPGQIGITTFYPTTLVYGQHELMGAKDEEFRQAIAELIDLGWIKGIGRSDGVRKFSLIKRIS